MDVHSASVSVAVYTVNSSDHIRLLFPPSFVCGLHHTLITASSYNCGQMLFASQMRGLNHLKQAAMRVNMAFVLLWRCVSYHHNMEVIPIISQTSSLLFATYFYSIPEGNLTVELLKLQNIKISEMPEICERDCWSFRRLIRCYAFDQTSATKVIQSHVQ